VSFALYPYVVPLALVSIQHAGLGLLALVVVFQLTRFMDARRLIQTLPAEARGTASDWLHRSSFHQVVSLFLNIIVFVYLITPVIYIATRAVQKWLIYPLFKQATQEFIAVQIDAVRKFGFIILEGNTALIFTRMEQAFEPSAGAGQFWPDFLWPLLPYAFFSWATVLLFRLAMPWSWSYPRWQGVWKIIRIAGIVTLASLVLQEVAVRFFLVNRNSVTLWLAVLVVGFIFAVYLHHALDPGVVCPKEGCNRRNPSNANFCLSCGENLEALRQARDSNS